MPNSVLAFRRSLHHLAAIHENPSDMLRWGQCALRKCNFNVHHTMLSAFECVAARCTPDSLKKHTHKNWLLCGTACHAPTRRCKAPPPRPAAKAAGLGVRGANSASFRIQHSGVCINRRSQHSWRRSSPHPGHRVCLELKPSSWEFSVVCDWIAPRPMQIRTMNI